MKIIYFHQQDAFDAIPSFDGLDEATAVAVAHSNENCLVYNGLAEFVKAFNNGELDVDNGFISIVGNETNFTDAERNLIKESILCKVRQDSRAAKQITNQQAISLIETEKQTLIGLLNRF